VAIHPPCTRLSRSLTQPNPHHHSLFCQAPRAGVLLVNHSAVLGSRAPKPIDGVALEGRCAGGWWRSDVLAGQSRAGLCGSSHAAGRRPSACTSHLAETAVIYPSPAPQGTEGHDSSDKRSSRSGVGKMGGGAVGLPEVGAGWSRRRPPRSVRVLAQEPSVTSAPVSSAQPCSFAF
jgi:hypothetical protein